MASSKQEREKRKGDWGQRTEVGGQLYGFCRPSSVVCHLPYQSPIQRDHLDKSTLAHDKTTVVIVTAMQ